MAATAKPLLPLDPLPVGTPPAQFYTTLNLNYLRDEVLAKPALSFEATQPGSPVEDGLYVLSAAWGDEVEGTLAYYSNGTWYYFTPVVGLLKRIDADYYVWEATEEWVAFNPGGAVISVNGGTGAVLTLQALAIAFSDETTAITAGTGKATFHVPYDFTLAGDKVMVGLTTPQTSGSIFTVDVNVAGATILSTKATIDNTEETTLTAATPLVCTATTLTKGQKVTIDVDQVGDGTAKGGKVYLIGYPTP